MSARVEGRAIGKRLEQRPLRFAHHRRHGNLHNREKVPRPPVRLGQSSVGDAQLLSGMGSGRDFQADIAT
jgi:hypothetical protein